MKGDEDHYAAVELPRKIPANLGEPIAVVTVYEGGEVNIKTDHLSRETLAAALEAIAVGLRDPNHPKGIG